ncbi:hypothetical protein GCM10009413_20310 [Tatumella punctata]
MAVRPRPPAALLAGYLLSLADRDGFSAEKSGINKQNKAYAYFGFGYSLFIILCLKT